jgi:hypothetical protein
MSLLHKWIRCNLHHRRAFATVFGEFDACGDLQMTGIDKRANHEVERGQAPMQPGERKAQWSTPRLIRPGIDLTELVKPFSAVESGVIVTGPAS